VIQVRYLFIHQLVAGFHVGIEMEWADKDREIGMAFQNLVDVEFHRFFGQVVVNCAQERPHRNNLQED
jgi:hypothetical protein